MKKLKKYICLLIMFVIMGFTLYSWAEEASNDDNKEEEKVGVWIFNPDNLGYYATSTTENGALTFCFELGKHLSRDSRISGVKENDTYNNDQRFCETDEPKFRYNEDPDGISGTYKRPKGSYSGYYRLNAYTSEFETAEVLDYKANQQISYALACMSQKVTEEQENLATQDQIQTVIWKAQGFDKEQIKSKHSSGASYISDAGLYKESKAYQKYYENKEEKLAKGENIIEDKTDYKEATTKVDQTNQTYKVGPYKIDYSKGIYNKKDQDGNITKTVKFAYIDEIKLLSEGNKELEIIDIVTTNNESIKAREGYKFPNSKEKFYLVFKYDNNIDVNKVHIVTYYKYLDECQAKLTLWSGTEYEWGYVKEYITDSAGNNKLHEVHGFWETVQDGEDEEGNPIFRRYWNTSKNKNEFHFVYKKAPYESLQKNKHGEPQQILTASPFGKESYFATPIWKDAVVDSKDNEIEITMELQGNVFIDKQAEKDMTNLKGINGIIDGIDEMVPNVEVTLYEADGKIAKLVQDNEEKEIRTNPTLTDGSGHYEFKGLDAQKKYYVTYKFNGQKYETTQYMFDLQKYNTKNWEISSKATLLDYDRVTYNNKFAQINSAPANYTAINDITGFGLKENKTYNIYEQTYEKAQRETDDINKLQESIIKKIRMYIAQFKKYPDDLAKGTIYQTVANEAEKDGMKEARNKVQYIVDLEVTATTGKGASKQLYPVYDKFNIGTKKVTIGNEVYMPIYEGQKYINCGIMEREKFDLTLSKDLAQIKVTINDKDYTYNYNKRFSEEIKEIELRGTDVGIYERPLRESDVSYIKYVNYGDKRLRVFVTYRIRIKNQSNNTITGYVTELNDFYDSDYTYLNSHVVTYNETGIDYDKKLSWTNRGTTLNTTELSTIPINVSEYIDIYNEFEVNTEAVERVLNASDKENTHENYAEIAGYKTIYQNRRVFENGDQINIAGQPAGLVDRDSRPGDFKVTDEVKNFVEYSYTDEFQNKGGEEKTKLSLNYFQDDADKAPGLRLKLLMNLREVNGNVWEDSVISEVLEKNNIRKGDGINNESSAIQGMKVELVVVDEGTSSNEYTPYTKVADVYNGKGMFEKAETTTSKDGKYSIKGYIPGDYLIRFTYGTGETLTLDSNGKIYNGQDYKSTLYDTSDHIIGDNREDSYWYDKIKNKYTSDAYDNLTFRNKINNDNRIMNNHVANILDYQSYANVADRNKLKELENRTNMFADTPKLVLEVEYARSESDLNDEDKIKEYKVENVDFGIVERPRSELTIEKKVKNIRIIANSGQTIFDADKATTNLSWIPSNTYDRSNGWIQAVVDENLMHGATVKILYQLTIKNTGERDYVRYVGDKYIVDPYFYNTSNAEDAERMGAVLATTKADYIIDYVENNLKFTRELDKFDANINEIGKDAQNRQNWIELETSEKDMLVNSEMILFKASEGETVRNIVNKYSTIIKAINSPLLKELTPSTEERYKGQEVSDTLLLTKVLNTDSNEDNLTYNNGIEIIQTINQEGRRSYNSKDKSKSKNDSISETIKSIPGNYNPKDMKTAFDEPDSDISEEVLVTVPYGDKNMIPTILGITLIMMLLAGGIYFIKKRVI